MSALRAGNFKQLQLIAELKVENKRLKEFCNEFVWGEENPHEYRTLETESKQRLELLMEFKNYLKYLPATEDTQILASKLHREWLSVLD